jgi:ATP-dependent helicase HrpA
VTPAERYTAWTFGQLPELLELNRGGQSLIGFPALIDRNTHVEIEVFDEPDAAMTRHRAGLRRLVALAIKEPLKYLERNIADLNSMVTPYMQVGRQGDGSGGGTADELRSQIVDVALDRAFLVEPLPTDSAAFDARVSEGRSRLNLIAQEVARLAATVLAEYAATARKLRDSHPPREAADDIAGQLQRLVPRRFLSLTPYPQLQHLPRYLKAVTMRLEKLRADPLRDTARLAELRPLEQAFLRRQIELKGQSDTRLNEYRWLIEELRVSLFAQELRTPQPVSVKRLEKSWQQIQASKT